MHERPNTIDRIDPDEQKLAEVHKHPFGIIIIYIQTFIAMVAAIGLLFFVVPSVLEDTDQALLVATLFTVVAVIFAMAVLAVSTFIYRQNRIIVTDRNITQILQFGLFSRKVSQLNIVNVEDVTSVQSGIIPTLLNFGVLKIETAGEQSNFDFNFCPNSGHVAKIILDAREKMLGQMDEGSEALTDVKQNRSVKSKVKRRVRSLNESQPEKHHHKRIQGIGAEVIERAHEPPDND